MNEITTESFTRTEAVRFTRTVGGVTISVLHQYGGGESRRPETEAFIIETRSGMVLATGAWSTHMDPAEVAGSRVDAWLADDRNGLGCGWSVISE